MKNDDATFWAIFSGILALAGVWLAVTWFLQQWWSIPLVIGLGVLGVVFLWYKVLKVSR